VNFYSVFLKRFLDIFISLSAIIILSPLFIIIILSIKIDSTGPVFFRQTRVGRKGDKFKIWKFRSMLIFEESFYSDGTEISNYNRITKVGNFLRKTSLDELPQLINILVGDMSLIGPRPTLEYQVERYNNFQLKRLEVRPGLTGLAQINGRNSLTWKEKIDYDVSYVENLSLILDLKIFLKTFVVLLRQEDNKFISPDELSAHKGTVEEDVNR